MVIQTRLRNIEFTWFEERGELVIQTITPHGIYFEKVVIRKAYIFSLMRFIIRIAQRMWGRKIKKFKL